MWVIEWRESFSCTHQNDQETGNPNTQVGSFVLEGEGAVCFGVFWQGGGVAWGFFVLLFGGFFEGGERMPDKQKGSSRKGRFW